MAHINLLPWREEERKRKKKEFITITASAAMLMAGIGLVVYMVIAGMIDHQIAKNNFLNNEIKKVDKKIKEIEELEQKKDQLVARMKIIEQLQGNRPEVVHMFDELAKVVPEGLYISDIRQELRVITIEGSAQSNARVSALMRALEASEWFKSPSLNVITTTKGRGTSKYREFSLKVTQANPEEKKKDVEGEKK